MPKKVLFVVTSHGELGDTGKPTGYFLSEVTHPWSEVSKELEIDVVSPKGGKPPVTGFDLNDPINKKYWEDEAWQEKMDHTLTPAQVNPDDYIAIYYAGGHGAMWDLPDNKEIADIAEKIYKNGGVVAAVCHGPTGLVKLKATASVFSSRQFIITMSKARDAWSQSSVAGVKKRKIPSVAIANQKGCFREVTFGTS